LPDESHQASDLNRILDTATLELSKIVNEEGGPSGFSFRGGLVITKVWRIAFSATTTIGTSFENRVVIDQVAGSLRSHPGSADGRGGSGGDEVK